MNDTIYEVVITTISAAGQVHVAPMGVRYEGLDDRLDAPLDADGDARVVLMPFKPSTTLTNLLETGHAVLNVVTDTRVFAGSVTGRRDWPTLAAEHVPGRRLQAAALHLELLLREVQDDPQRPVLRLVPVHRAVHRGVLGFNRAQAAVIEGAVLVSRLHLLPREKIETEMTYLQIAIDKTASAEEHEAWGWLRDAVAAHAAAAADDGVDRSAAR